MEDLTLSEEWMGAEWGGKVGGSGRRGRERELVSIYEIKKDHFKEKKIKENKRKCPHRRAH